MKERFTTENIYINQFITLINALSDKCITNVVKLILEDKPYRRKYQRMTNRCFNSLVNYIVEYIHDYMRTNKKRGIKHIFVDTTAPCFGFQEKNKIEFNNLRLFPEDQHFKAHLKTIVLKILNNGRPVQKTAKGALPDITFYNVLYTDIKDTLEHQDFISVEAAIFTIVCHVCLHTHEIAEHIVSNACYYARKRDLIYVRKTEFIPKIISITCPVGHEDLFAPTAINQ